MPVRAKLFATTALSGAIGSSLLAFASQAADLVAKAQPAWVAPMPAVDGFNWKLGGLGGSMADGSLGGAQGSFSLPIGAQYGIQIDGFAGAFDGRFAGAGAGHFFWRNPNQGLLGLYVAHTHWDRAGGLYATQVAGEGEVYWGRFTIQGIAGVEFGNSKTERTGVLSDAGATTTFFETYDVKTRFFDKVNVAYYFQDNLKGFVGHRYLGGKHALALGGEWAFPVNGPLMGAVFAEGRVGENDFRGIWGGLRYYWGNKDKTLISRHRQDDPIDWTPESLFSITNSLSNSAKKTKKPDDNPCPPGYTYIPGEGCIFFNPS